MAHCSACRKIINLSEYGMDRDGQKYCYNCCADLQRARMIETGRATLYLCRKTIKTGRGPRSGCWYVTDWPDRLHFPVGRLSAGKHNIARTRLDVWFRGPDGYVWHGIQYGEWTQVCHCKRTQELHYAYREALAAGEEYKARQP